MKNIIVVYPGRFQPFHQGHAAVYNSLKKKYGVDNVYICTSNKVELPKSPFTFHDKVEMIALTGIDACRVIQSSQPYRAPEILSLYNQQSTVILFAVSVKDMLDSPRFSFTPKKDGSPSYFQPLPADISHAKTSDVHGYIITVPTFNFDVLNLPVSSATEIRSRFANADRRTKKYMVTSLFGKYNTDVYNIMNEKIINTI